MQTTNDGELEMKKSDYRFWAQKFLLYSRKNKFKTKNAISHCMNSQNIRNLNIGQYKH